MVSGCALAVEWLSVAWLDLVLYYYRNLIPWFENVFESNNVFTQ